MPALPRSQPVTSEVAQADCGQRSLHGYKVPGMSRAACPLGGSMKQQFSRRNVLGKLGATLAGILSAPVARAGKEVVQKVFVTTGAEKDYDPTKHKWQMAIDINKCIGCGLCAEACKKENNVPAGPYYRTWIERYIIKK